MNRMIKRNPDLFGGILESVWNDSIGLKSLSHLSFSGPAVNIKNKENSFEIEVAAPGLKKEDFQIEIEENQLKLSVNKSNETQVEEENFTRKEFDYFQFERSFLLPKGTIDAENIQAQYVEGILKLSLPKLKLMEEKIKKIAVS